MRLFAIFLHFKLGELQLWGKIHSRRAKFSPVFGSGELAAVHQ